MPPANEFPTSLFRDGAIRYGIKFGIAGVAAVFLALLIRLENPTWALFTVFVLMLAQYVGAVAEKSLFRFIGTVVGGLLGFVLTGSLEQSPAIFLPLVGAIVAFCTAMFGQSRYPYAFLLCGMTTLVVVSNGWENPEQSWTYMLDRVEEVSLGILVTLVVHSVVWPRYARVEFLDSVRESFSDLRDCFLACPGVAPEATEAAGAVRAGQFAARISNLRGLLEFGARESRYFRGRLATYFELTVCLARIANAIATIREPLPPDSLYRRVAGGELDALHQAIAGALEELCRPESSGAGREQCLHAMNQAFQALESRLEAMRSDPRLNLPDIGAALVLGIHSLALDEIREAIARAHVLLDPLPAGGASGGAEPGRIIPPMPPKLWIHSGIKSGLAMVVALVIDNWLSPPGGPMFVLGTWVFTAMNPASPGGQGDRKAFFYVTTSALTLVVLSFILLAARPLLSSYAVMNTVLFTWLFVWGYLSYRIRGMNQPMQFAMLCIVGILGLNGQEPISFQAIVGFFFGLALAVVVSAVIQRVLWPSLPQWEARDRFVELIGICRELIRCGPADLPLWRRTRFALIPGETALRIGLLDPPVCPEGEQDRLREILLTLSRVSGHLIVTLRRLLPLVPPELQGEAGPRIAQMESLIDANLAGIQKSFEDAAPPASGEDGLRAAIDAWIAWIAGVREAMLRADASPILLLRILGLAERYRLAGEDVLEARRLTAQLRLPLYMGDFEL